ncbi:PaaI family thioesterase [uncultured Tateyamaria sp.]|uniref:PaaI family thioesterase n=1 Tax=uncultured Tateyamaria sp. TaxID=455651 RepID=UPI00260A7440|nr:PaaI family thioesterase [uncultured Tateyamaria sp.]
MRDRIKASFARQSMMRTFGATLDSIEPGLVTISAPILPGSRQQQGFAHAALTFGLGDSAAGYAALTTLPEDQEVVTAEIKINLIAPATGDRLIAKGRVVKPGRRLIVVTSEVFVINGDTETLVAILQGTMVPVQA